MGTYRLLSAAVAGLALAACGSPEPPTATVYGDVVLSSGYAYRSGNDLIRPDQLAHDANPFQLPCTGIGPFVDVSQGAVVSLLDGAGAVVASGTIKGSEPTLGEAHTMRCTLAFTIEQAPTGISGAQIRVGQHPPVTVKADYDRGHSTVNITV